MGITENAAYLKGLFDGFELKEDVKETKIIKGLIDLVSDMADKIDALEADNNELREYIEEIDQDLGAVEEDLYVDGDDYEDLNDDEEFDFDDDSEYYEIECPHCGEQICFDDSLEVEELVCPACGEKVDGVEIVEEEK